MCWTRLLTPPDTFYWAWAIYCVQGMYNEAREVFDDMKKAGCKPNVVTYTSLVFTYSNAGLLIHILHVSICNPLLTWDFLKQRHPICNHIHCVLHIVMCRDVRTCAICVWGDGCSGHSSWHYCLWSPSNGLEQRKSLWRGSGNWENLTSTENAIEWRCLYRNVDSM